MRHLVPRLLRGHLGGLAASFVALVGASALLTALGVVLQTGLTAHAEAERHASASAVVTADRTIEVGRGGETQAEPATEQVELPFELVDRLGELPGVAAAVAELTFPAEVVGPDGRPLAGPDGHPSLGHGWSSAALAPFTPTSGREPRATGEVVLDRGLAERAGAGVGDRVTG
ncbi:ABC transporter permease [Streptomyces sp. NPDC127098]|uniref:ABC transporter permease n=1 Tax=Streptomyces sp. NPDC127098 TaxID=3347137 RepID=UPI00364DF857